MVDNAGLLGTTQMNEKRMLLLQSTAQGPKLLQLIRPKLHGCLTAQLNNDARLGDTTWWQQNLSLQMFALSLPIP